MSSLLKLKQALLIYLRIKLLLPLIDHLKEFLELIILISLILAKIIHFIMNLSRRHHFKVQVISHCIEVNLTRRRKLT